MGVAGDAGGVADSDLISRSSRGGFCSVAFVCKNGKKWEVLDAQLLSQLLFAVAFAVAFRGAAVTAFFFGWRWLRGAWEVAAAVAGDLH
jgi:uncharacterized integral membrane protein